MSTETTEKTETTSVVETKEEKREFINISVTKEQKSAITKAAITDCGVTVSEYCRTKILAPKQEPEEQKIISSDEETILAYEERLKKDSETIKKQAEEIIQLKILKSVPVLENKETDAKEEELPIISESAIVLELTPEQRKIVDDSIVYETNSFFGNEYKDVYHFIKKKLGDLVTSNHDSFPDEYHTKGTPEYKTAYEFIQFLKGKNVVTEQK